VRAMTGVLAALVAAGAALWLNHLANAPDSTTLAYVLTGAICAGAVIYVAATALGYGQLALLLRWLGWVAMTLPLIVPSTLSLALPIVAALGVTLRPLPPQPARKHPPYDRRTSTTRRKPAGL
jgi:hypothetical protein